MAIIRPAERAEQAPGLRCRFGQGDHLGLGEQVLHLAATLHCPRHQPDQPGKIPQ